MLTFSDDVPEHARVAHAPLKAVCELHNWDINCKGANSEVIRLSSARKSDLEALRAFLLITGRYSFNDMFSDQLEFICWAEIKS